MQAGKIEVGERYAYREASGELVQFIVNSVTTTRSKTTFGRGISYASIVSGFIDRLDGNPREPVERLDPKELLGKYDEHKELVEREAAEKRRKDADEKARTKAVRDAAMALYRLLDMPPPKKEPGRFGREHPVENHDAPIRVSYDDIEFKPEAWRKLVDVLQKLKEAA